MSEPTASPLPSLGEARGWTGCPVDDVGGSRIGTARGCFVDAASGDPSWLIAKLGRFRSSLVAIPLRDCAGGGGRVWIAHAGADVRGAPVVDPTRPLLREHELTICAHYGIGESVGRAAEVVGQAEGSVTSQPG